jgi:hypothetical protein
VSWRWSDDRPLPVLRQRSLLKAYVDRFDARDFEAIRDMLAGEVRLELVNKTQKGQKLTLALQKIGRSARHEALAALRSA